MRDAYLVVLARVFDRAKLEAYNRALAASGLYARHGGEYVFLGRAALALEAWENAESVVVARFPSRAAAEAFWFDDEYQQHIRPLRSGAGDFRVAVFDGVVK